MYLKRFLSTLLIAALVFIPASLVLAQEEEPEGTIVDIAGDREEFSTLVAALTVGNLLDALASDGPFTVFAPTNEAFAELPEGTLEGLIADPSGELANVLRYHVLPGLVLAEDLSDGLEAETLQGNTVVFSVDGDTVFINDSEILTTDIEASNGVIHTIDAVLLPSAADETAEADEVEVDEVEVEEVTEEEDIDEEALEEEALEEEIDDEEVDEVEIDEVEIDEVEEVTEEEDIDEEALEEEALEEEIDDEEVDEVEIDEVETDEVDAMTEEEEVEVAEDGDTPDVVADDQTSDGTLLTVGSVTATQAGWIVIHLDADGSPGPVIGQTAVPAGTTENVIVFLDEEIAGETDLWAMLHVDEGEPGVYEFPGADVPVRVNDIIVMAPFTASAPDGIDEVTEEEIDEVEIDDEEVDEVEVEEVEEIDEVDEVDEAEEEAVVAEEEVDEEEAPVTLPATGGGMTGTPLAVAAAALVILALGAGSFVSRRRLA